MLLAQRFCSGLLNIEYADYSLASSFRDEISAMKLRTMLMLSFLLIAALPVYATMLYLNKKTAGEFRERISQELEAISLIAEKRVRSVADRVRDNTALVASRTQMRILLAASDQEAIDEKNRLELKRILTDAQKSLESLYEISLYDRTGRLVISTLETPAVTHISVENASQPEIFLEHGEAQSLLVSLKRLDLNGRVIGYLRLSLGAGFLLDLTMDRTGLGKTGEWLVAVPDEAGNAMFAVPLKYDSAAAFNRRVPKDRYDVPITQALLGNETLMQWAPDYREVPVMAYTRYLDALGWGLVVKIDESEITALVAESRHQVTQFAVFMVALFALLGVALAIFIAGPAERLRVRVKNLRDGYPIETRVRSVWGEAVDMERDLDALYVSRTRNDTDSGRRPG